MKSISKKILSFIIIICITIMSVTSLASCGSSEQNNSAKTSKASNSVSENSNENNDRDEYNELLKKYLDEQYKDDPDVDYLIDKTSRLTIEVIEKKENLPCEEYLSQMIDKNITDNNLGENIEVKKFKIRKDQTYDKKQMAKVRDFVNEKFSYIKGKDISDVHVISYSYTVKGSTGKIFRNSGIINVLKEKGAWKVCIGANREGSPAELLTLLNEYSA